MPLPSVRLTEERSHKPYQQLWVSSRAAQWEDSRRSAAQMANMEVDGQRFDGFGVGEVLKEKPGDNRLVGRVRNWRPPASPLGHFWSLRPFAKRTQAPTPSTASTSPAKARAAILYARRAFQHNKRTLQEGFHPASRRGLRPLHLHPARHLSVRRRRSCRRRSRPFTTSGLHCVSSMESAHRSSTDALTSSVHYAWPLQ